VFVTFKLGEARLAEQVLTEAGVEYEVSVEVLGRTLFGFRRNGVVFSVEAGHFTRAAAVLSGAGLGSGVMPEPPGIPDRT
jgi:hypothetical protein